MHKKRIIAVAAVAAATGLMLTPAPSYAASANWSGTVDSGGAVKVFDTQRTATQQVHNVVYGTAEAGISLVACTSLSTVSGEWHMYLNQSRTFGATAGKCFRQSIHRWSAKDTNGILPGNGTTTLNGNIQW